MKKKYFVLPLFFLALFLKSQDRETERAMDRIYKHADYQKALKNPAAATHVYIKNYTDTVFPNADILQFRNLVSLAVEGLCIMRFKASGSSFHRLRIDTAKLKQLPQLRYLALNGFDFSDFPEELCSLQQLKGLALAVCRIKALPPSISRLSELSYLQLRVNDLVSLPEEFASLQKLEVLDLCNNKLKSVPVQISRLKQLRELYLSNVESDKFIPAAPEFPVDIHVNRIDYLSSYETVRLILSSEKMRRMDATMAKCDDPWLFIEKLGRDHIRGKTVITHGHCSTIQ